MDRVKTLIFFAAIAALLPFSSGCKTKCSDSKTDAGTSTETCTVEPLKKYVDGSPRTASTAWLAGASISITNHNGSLNVFADGTGDEVTTSATAFDLEGASDQQAATDFLSTFANPSVTSDASGNVVVDAPGGGNHGYDIDVHIPAVFDGALSVQNGNGPAVVTTTSTTTGVVVHSDNGDVTIGGIGPSLEGTTNSITTALGDISVGIASTANVAITATATSGTVTTPADWSNAVFNDDHSAAGITLGTGTAMLTVSTDLGDVTFSTQ